MHGPLNVTFELVLVLCFAELAYEPTIVRETKKAEYLFCFFRQFNIANNVLDTRSHHAASKLHRPETKECHAQAYCTSLS